MASVWLSMYNPFSNLTEKAACCDYQNDFATPVCEQYSCRSPVNLIKHLLASDGFRKAHANWYTSNTRVYPSITAIILDVSRSTWLLPPIKWNPLISFVKYSIKIQSAAKSSWEIKTMNKYRVWYCYLTETDMLRFKKKLMKIWNFHWQKQRYTSSWVMLRKANRHVHDDFIW